MVEELFRHKQEQDDTIIDIRIFRVPPSATQVEGVSYSLVYVVKGIRVVGYDNFEGHRRHGSTHHRHIDGKIIPYTFVDYWQLIEDFMNDVDQWK